MKKTEAMTAQVDANNQKRSRGSMPAVRNVMPRKNEEWSASHKMRLPHKIGLPLGSGGGGDDTGSGF